MTLADDLKQTVFDGRGIAGSLGFRTHTVEVVVEHFDGQHTGEGSLGQTITPITEGGGHSPKVRALKDDEIALAALPNGTLEIGPITPEFAAGGTSDDLLFGPLPVGSTRYFRVTGPLAPEGALYRLSGSSRDRTLRRMLRVEPVTPSQ